MNLEDAFTIFDQDRDGHITPAELRDGLSAIGVFPTSEEVDLFFHRYDDDSNNRVSIKEFAQAFSP